MKNSHDMEIERLSRIIKEDNRIASCIKTIVRDLLNNDPYTREIIRDIVREHLVKTTKPILEIIKVVGIAGIAGFVLGKFLMFFLGI